jgi:GTPase SAR1 family protein
MVVYDLTDPESFKNVEMWMGEIDKFAASGVSKLLIGNKLDMAADRKVSTEEGAALAKKYNIKFLETSAKSSTNVLDAFKTMTEEMHARVSKKTSSVKPTPGMTPTSMEKSRGIKKIAKSHRR